MNHLHVFHDHPSWKTHVACIICGFALPTWILPGAVAQGAKDARDPMFRILFGEARR